MNSSFKEKAPEYLKIVCKDDPLYQYARVISNTRFGHMPDCIAYCKKASHVQYCINYCRDNNAPFRIRSGGHQHEGMCSADNVIIIDLSEIHEIIYESDTTAWIPAGKQLGQVYDELAKHGKTIPGGGCQSVNVGGLTQGGGWGVSVRKFGLTCDSVTEIEIVLASGEIVIANALNEYSDLFKALKGGGGGNFGVVIGFKFNLVSILPVVTTFGLLWENPETYLPIITKWAKLHAISGAIDESLSATCTMIIANTIDKDRNEIHGRMGGKFYGSEKNLRILLKEYFGEDVIETADTANFNQIPEDYDKIPSNSTKKSQKNEHVISYATDQRALIDFINPAGKIQYVNINHGSCQKLDLTVLPNSGPSSTCDRPHPHKVSSSFPKDDVDHAVLVEAIYTYLDTSCYYADVNMYMSFHCMGGAVTRSTDNSFGYSQKPYMLQIQCWWDDVSNAFTNVGRNTVYVAWVKQFRESIAEFTEGSFINFVDKTLVADIEEDANRLKLLEIYYTKKNLDMLCGIKKKYDPTQLFNFEMSILPSD
ncbi:putative FAD-linked oxidoreductase YvdP [Kordia sp. SMS9]|uniref:FAD-dependent oxidoreductase n=1 Tax=Kordia sp. SMS9 TaxID=2282170 RepID=UPI000E0DEDD6|nr:FAD-dependent oxidoreductase [Kordia sp. SMS9]AXG71293.1 putative FAD-linked oxidoreductase YvdP [Kordia sp. SMS9]